MKFERPEQSIEKLDRGEFFAEKIVEMGPELRLEAEKLNKLGFSVDENCRIKPELFLGPIAVKELKNDLQKVKDLKAKFDGEAKRSPEKQAEKNIGEALEMAKTIGVNGHWFGGRFLAVRSSMYDDFCGNKVDNLIYDSQTFEPLAAIDATTDQASKLPQQKEIFKKILEGAEVKYGYKLEKSDQAPGFKAVKNPNMKLPYFIISFKPDELEEIARSLAAGTGGSALHDASKGLVERLSEQAENFSQHPAIKPEIKAAYGRFLKIFESLRF
ncbi:MAG: hypothetical protein G01um101419_16 [Parcubacteria group bacterium Gr01-1014_19]|nr:MAG: hypothetical protein G01um101419_16 [Parcubacteria group bacterium Gr01-1014_19]